LEDKDMMEKNEGEILVAPDKKEGQGEKEKVKKEERPSTEAELNEFKDKYLRLYAEFENYKKRVQREKEDLVKYSREDILYNILPVIDNLEMALQHSDDKFSEGLVKGVEITLREFQRVTEKFGLASIPATGKPFDPAVHHAMSQVERADAEDNTVVEEFRKGYMLGDKVLRPSLVAVSKKPDVSNKSSIIDQEIEDTEEEIKINKSLKEE
jgi:molecular chaperone GrpE